MVTFEVTRLILATPVGLVGRSRLDEGARRTCAVTVRVDVHDVDDQSTAHRRLGSCRDQLMIDGRAMQPDDLCGGTDLAMDDPAVVIAIQTTGREPSASTRNACAASMSS